MASPVSGYFPNNYSMTASQKSLSTPSTSTSGVYRQINGDDDDDDDDDDNDDSSIASSSSSSSTSTQLQQRTQEEWEDNVRQLQLALSVLILPTLGKYLGRRWAYSRKFCVNPIFPTGQGD